MPAGSGDVVQHTLTQFGRQLRQLGTRQTSQVMGGLDALEQCHALTPALHHALRQRLQGRQALRRQLAEGAGDYELRVRNHLLAATQGIALGSGS